MRFYNIDQHVSVITDLARIFKDLGHEIVEHSLSGHCYLFGKTKHADPLIMDNINDPLAIVDEFAKQYGKDLKQYDGFVVTYPPVFAALFAQFGKPVIVDIPIRYELPYQGGWNLGKRKRLEDVLCLPNVHLVANNAFDKAYVESYIDKPVHHIQSLCEYTGMDWNPVHDEAVVFDRTRRLEFDGSINKGDLRDIPWSELCKYSAFVHVPYNVSTMSFFEQYSACLPLFYPSDKLMLELCAKKQALQELFWTSEQQGKYNWGNIEEILPLADFNVLPHVHRFDNMADLLESLGNDAFMECNRKAMQEYNTIRHERVYQQWREVIAECQ